MFLVCAVMVYEKYMQSCNGHLVEMDMNMFVFKTNLALVYDTLTGAAFLTSVR